jgi:hypothetical protein
VNNFRWFLKGSSIEKLQCATQISGECFQSNSSTIGLEINIACHAREQGGRKAGDAFEDHARFSYLRVNFP